MKALKLCYYTGNKALDIVLTQKASLCEDAGVQLVCSADGSCLSGMTHYHIYSLLGNAIDNAIECLAKVDDAAKKVISLTLSRRGDMAVICIENYTPGPPVLRDGVLVTTKQDASGHGYGVKSGAVRRHRRLFCGGWNLLPAGDPPVHRGGRAALRRGGGLNNGNTRRISPMQYGGYFFAPVRIVPHFLTMVPE